MSKQKTAMQDYIEWLEKQLAGCTAYSPAIPFIVIAINKAKDFLPTERQQIEQAFSDGFDSRFETARVERMLSDEYYEQTYNEQK